MDEDHFTWETIRGSPSHGSIDRVVCLWRTVRVHVHGIGVMVRVPDVEGLKLVGQKDDCGHENQEVGGHVVGFWG